MSESAYIQGSRMAWRMMLAECIKNLYGEADGERWRLERADIEHQLRNLCAALGIEYPEGLYLADVIEKHIRPEVVDE